MNYMTPKSRAEVLELLVNGLKRLEYRGYDSTGVAIDGPNTKDIVMIKSVGKVKVLEDAIAKSMNNHHTTICDEFYISIFLLTFKVAPVKSLRSR